VFFFFFFLKKINLIFYIYFIINIVLEKTNLKIMDVFHCSTSPYLKGDALKYKTSPNFYYSHFCWDIFKMSPFECP
jgi:hypothetical protein